ncbi:hypothetical protein [Syntrophomonas wolfei]|uniref:hypothetical protein n=1 Tax=Syntrophomonas wolfei TaxID=863 RepID=UPI0023F22FB0|nr:hypothetical protein [Syntrophomonas wolfei]
MTQVLIYVLIALAALLGVILLAPVHIDFRGEYAQTLSFHGRLRWAGGLLSLDLKHHHGKLELTPGCLGLKKTFKKAAEGKKQPDGQESGPDKRRKGQSDSPLSFLNLRLLAAVNKSIRRLLRALHLKVKLSGVYGFDDPSLTGFVLGVMTALGTVKNYSIDLKPEFAGEAVDLRGWIQTWFIPFHILFIVLGLILKKPVRAIWWPKIKNSKKHKEAVQYA